MGEWIWLLEGCDRESGYCLVSHRLIGLSDSDAKYFLGLESLGDGDVYDIPEDSLAELALRFGLELFPDDLDYLLGRGAV